MSDSPWAVAITAADGTLSLTGPFGFRHRAEHFAESVDGIDARPLELEAPAKVRDELRHAGNWTPPNSETRRRRMHAAKLADPNRLDWSDYR